MMGLIEKIETFINRLLFKFAELVVRLIPHPLKQKYNALQNLLNSCLSYLKTLPRRMIEALRLIFIRTKTSLLSRDLKAVAKDAYVKSSARIMAKDDKKFGRVKSFLMTPVLILGQWLRGLTVTQASVLMTFSAASCLAIVGMFFSGQRLLTTSGNSREPASIPEIAYERPVYYKKQTRHFNMVNVRLPVYVASVNEIKSVDIDFIATLSNRFSKKFLEKQEFQLRDHLIINVEPSVASFPLEEEGKDIIREKLLREINVFLVENSIEGKVVELKITYVLAN